MAMSLFWLGKVVRNISAVAIVLAVITQVDGQSLHSKNITFCCSSSNFETVIEDLSKATGVHFVYSSNKIPTSRHFRLSVTNKPLGEVLDLLSKQMNLSFKIQEHYVTIRSGAGQNQAALVEQVSLRKVTVPQQIALQAQAPANAENEFGAMVAQKMAKATALSSKREDMAPDIAKLKPYFNPAFLEKIPVSYLQSTTRQMNGERHWFVTVGSVINDYSAGVEVQAGLRHAYLVFSPTWLRDNEYHGGFGIGTSLQLSNTFSLRPVYAYASMKENRIDAANSVLAKSPTYQTNTTTIHHQVKLMLQYDVSKKFKFRAGPTLNQTRSNSKYQSVETFSYKGGGPQHNPHDHDGPSGALRGNSIRQPASISSTAFWVGWEISLSYRINFK